MEMTDIKAWQWAIIGALVGVLLAAVYRNFDSPIGSSAPFSFREFNRDLGATGGTEKTRDMPLLRNIVVYPPETDPNGVAYQKVQLEQLNIHKDSGEPTYVPREFFASSQRDFSTFPSLQQWIDAQAKERADTWPGAKQIAYRAPLSANANLYFGAWALGGALVLGVAWPVVVWGMIGAGIVPKPTPKPKKIRQTKLKQQPEETFDDGVIRDEKKRANMTTEDQKKLDDVMAQLERNTAGMNAGRESDSVDEDAPANAPTPPPRVLTLNAGPLAQEVNAKPAEQDENKSYGGEWYPVARPTHKKE
jgi:hypothetical protein